MKKDKRKNQKGFTLIELLAVVVILLAISVMAISSISAAIERNKEKQNDAKKEVLISYGKLYYDEHKNTWQGSVTIETLISQYGLSDKETKDSDGKQFEGCIYFDTSDNTWEYGEDQACN